MKKIIRDTGIIEQFKSVVDSWIQEQSNGRFKGFSSEFMILELAELPLYRLTYNVAAESRKIVMFQKADASPVTSPASITKPEMIDPWALTFDRDEGNISYQRTIGVPESYKALRCKTCIGNGNMPCPGCQGQKAVHCGECRGEGIVICPVCRHTKYITCSKCNGTGSVYIDPLHGYNKCPECNGAKQFLCTECNNGYQICHICEGKKRLPCAKCDQTGTAICPVCSGAGQIVSGFGVEINYHPFEEKQEIPNKDLPNMILDKMLPLAGDWKKIEIIEKADPQTLNEQNVPLEIISDCKKIIEKPAIAQGSRIVSKRLLIERKLFFMLTYDVGGNTNTIFFTSPSAERCFYEHHPLLDLYADMLATANKYIKTDRIPEAQKILNDISEIKSMSEQVKKLRSEIGKSLLFPYLIGGLLAAVAVSVCVIPIITKLLEGSFHFSAIMGRAILFNIVSGLLSCAIFYFINPAFLKKRIVRFMASFLAGLIIPLSVYFTLSSMNYNPALEMDEELLNTEYNRHFPFGLTTLPNKKDIEFLEYLIIKYSSTGVSIDKIEKELAWLKSKKDESDSKIEQVEQIRKQIEILKASGNKKAIRKPRTGGRIKIRY